MCRVRCEFHEAHPITAVIRDGYRDAEELACRCIYEKHACFDGGGILLQCRSKILSVVREGDKLIFLGKCNKSCHQCMVLVRKQFGLCGMEVI